GLARVTQACIDLSKITEVTQDEDNNYQPDLEPYENMYVMIGGDAHIIEQYQLARFNEIRLAAGDRPVQFTQINTPNAAAYELYRKSVGARSIVYDDGLNEQNASISTLDGFANYAEATAPRMGDTVTDLQGVLDYQWAGNAASPATWRVRSHRDGTNTFTRTNPRPGSAPQIAGNVRIASFNVLNYFTTLDASGVTTAQGGDPRGADNATELTRQQAKLVNAIVDMNADVFGLVELENEFDDNRNGSTAIAVLVRAVNTALQNDGKADRYDYVYPGHNSVGNDVIAVALIYNTATIGLATGASPAILNDVEAKKLTAFQSHDFTADPVFTGNATNRASLAMTFEHTATGRSFTVSVNHFKSKGPSGLSTSSDPNYDAQDGAGFWNARRLKAAEIVTAWLDTDPSGVAGSLTVLLGDINAYAKEAPIQYITNNGYSNFEVAGAYSYVFDGQIGTLDYGFYKIEESSHVSFAGGEVWHINADEASALDYNTDFGRLTSYFDADTAIRSSDHDPLIGGFTFR
ncbi:MAG: ExeM/NucH family extracellular endonuclease, partial [Salinispira sp.]